MAFCCMPKPDACTQLAECEFEILNQESNLVNKILFMKEVLCLSVEELHERGKIVTKMTDLLKKYYPECQVIVFGSSANGFGFKGCDLDLLFLPFPSYCNLDFKEKGNGIIPVPYQILNGNCPRECLCTMKEESHLKFVQRIMYSKQYIFKRIHYIPAKCPILNIEFCKYPVMCDFTASNRLVANNTELLWLFGCLDLRVKPLVMFLRYWAKSLGFIKKSLLSSYCFTLMVMFYLQNTDPPILPSVHKLSELAGYSRIVDGWESAICMDLERIRQTRFSNETSLDQLVINFFDFYWNFDFIQYVVSPHHGRPLSVKELTESSDERIKSFQITSFSVQDPFILSRNISRNASMKTSFKLALSIARKFLLRKSSPFQLLFDPTYYQKEMSTVSYPHSMCIQSSSIFGTLQLNYELYCKLGMELNCWFQKVCETVLDVLQYGLLIECEVVDKLVFEKKTHSAKKRKVSDGIESELKLIMSIQCTVQFSTLWNRKKFKIPEHLNDKMEDPEIPAFLINEYRISKEMAKHDINAPSKLSDSDDETTISHLCFRCDCFQYPSKQISDVVICFSPLTKSKTFYAVRNFLKTFVEKHSKKILQES